MLDRSRRGSTQLLSGQLHGISFIFTPAALRQYKATLSALQLVVLTSIAVTAGATAAEMLTQCDFAWDVSVRFSWSCGC